MAIHLPNALVVGPRKSGTSWIQEYLKDRGDVLLPNGVKETFFFDRYHGKGIDWYASHFAEAASGQVQIEIAPTYFEDVTAPERIHAALGYIPIVVTLRDPASRTFSLYQHLRRYGEARAPFRKAVEDLGLLTGSLYAERLAHWQDVFGADRVQVLFTQDLAADPQTFSDALNGFFGLPAAPVPERLMGKFYEGVAAPNFVVAKVTNLVAQTLRSLRLYRLVNWLRDSPLKAMIFGKPNPNTPKETLSPVDREWLLAHGLRHDIEMLETMLGRSLPAWKS